MEKNFTEQDSLRIINEMIDRARNRHQKGAGSYSIHWGYFIAGLAILHYLLLHLLPSYNAPIEYASYVWYLPYPIAFAYFFYIRFQKKENTASTHIGKIISSIWIGFAISCLTLILLLSLTNKYLDINIWFVATPIILLFLGLAQFASAAALRFKLYYFAAAIFWVGSILAIAVPLFFNCGELQPIILAISMLLGFCVPGHILNHKAQKDV